MLKPETLDYLRAEAEKFGVEKMMLFGSCLYKPEDEAGDIDIAVGGLRKRDLHQFVGSILLDSKIDKKIDFVDLSDDVSIVPIILDEGVIIYEHEKQRVY